MHGGHAYVIKSVSTQRRLMINKKFQIIWMCNAYLHQLIYDDYTLH